MVERVFGPDVGDIVSDELVTIPAGRLNSMRDETRALVIAPHADDAEFGVGGTLRRLRTERAAVPVSIRVVIMACGDYVRLRDWDGPLRSIAA